MCVLESATALTISAVASSASVAIAAGGAALQYMGQQAQTAMQNKAAEQNAKLANESYREKQAYLHEQLLEKRASLLDESAQRTVMAEETKARALTSASESGVSGVALENVVNDIDRQNENAQQAVQYNYDIAKQDTYHATVNAQAEAAARINSMPGSIGPSIGTPLLQTAGAGLSAYSSYMHDYFSVQSLNQNKTKT